MSETINRFEDLIAWQKARQLTNVVYRLSAYRPFARDFAMRDQIRGAALSVMSNVAEGFERNRIPEFLYFLRVAKASCGEVRSEAYAAFDAGYIDDGKLQVLLTKTTEVARVIRGLQSSLADKPLGTRHSAPGTQ